MALDVLYVILPTNYRDDAIKLLQQKGTIQHWSTEDAAVGQAVGWALSTPKFVRDTSYVWRVRVNPFADAEVYSLHVLFRVERDDENVNLVQVERVWS